MSLKKIDLMHSIFGELPDKKCKDCSNLVSYHASRKWYKCVCYGETSSVASDWKISNVACGLFNREYVGNRIIKLVKRDSSTEMQMEGQVNIFDL